VVVTGSTYYYYGGVYYISSGTRYVIVAPPVGAVVYGVPVTTTVVYVQQRPYYYYGGTYYVVTVKPAETPPAATSAPGTATAAGSGKSSEGVNLDELDLPEVVNDEDNNYEVVKPPVGVTVPYLPDDASEKTVGGKKYFVYEETYYRQYASDGETIYMVVDKPS